jgi:hypothetical protein
MPNLCECGKLHYSLDHYFQVHGDYLPITEHRRQVEVLDNGKLFDSSKLKDNEEIPSTIIKWICKYCGNFNTTTNPDSHKKGCEFIAYLEFRKTTPYKMATGGTTSYYKPTSTAKPTETKKPKETTPTFEISPENLKKINKVREQLIDIMVEIKGIEKEPVAILLKEVTEIKEQAKDKKRGYFENWWNNVDDKRKFKIYNANRGILRDWVNFMNRW